MRARAALADSPGGVVEVITDSPESRENIVRFGRKEGCSVAWREREPGTFVVRLESGAAASAQGRAGSAVFITSDCLGSGDDGLGRLLMSLFLRTLSEHPRKPAHLLLANDGVRLALEGSDDLGTLGELENAGVAILVCGTCLDYYRVKDRLRVGTVSNMHEIVDVMMSGSALVRV
jgi:selenium metabolism protein YedF